MNSTVAKSDTKKSVCFRVDASESIGLGHMMRCLTLADELKKNGYHILFLCKEITKKLSEKIRFKGYDISFLESDFIDKVNVTKGFQSIQFDQDIDGKKSLKALWGQEWDLLVVDHYGLDCRWEKEVRPVARCLMVIDDLANRKHECDILLDQSAQRKVQEYRQLVPSNCLILTGSNYALLRSEFQNLRRQYLNRQLKKEPSLKKILISLGGGDQTNHIVAILNGLSQSVSSLTCSVIVIVGESNMDKIKSSTQGLDISVDLRQFSDDMASLLLESDLVIGAAGTSAWERCCLGVPSIVLVLASNQLDNAKALLDRKAAIIIPSLNQIEEKLTKVIEELIQFPDQLKKLAHAASQLVDGKGVVLVERKIKSILC